MRMTDRFRVAVTGGVLLLALGLAGCGGGGGGSSNPPPPTPDTTAPTVPQNLTATAASATQINLSWNASTDSGGSGLAGYRILRGGTQIATTPSTTYNDMGLTPSTAYSYTVRAYDNASPANVSADSAGANATTPATSPPPVVGLDARPSNTTCLAGAPPRTDTARLDRVFPALSFSSPILALQAPGDASRWFVVEQAGRVLKFPNTASPATSTFIDITARVASGGELGLLGMAFHPNFPTDRRVFLSYTAGSSGSRVSRISSFLTMDGGSTLDPASERILLTLNQPEDNHNGGNINFGPDGYLYVGFGDGGGGGDGHTQNGPIGNGQALKTMLGKMLRIDVGSVETATTYAIPSGNPFAANPKCGAGTNAASCPEIFAYGLRNPWRWSFDRQSGALWVGDVGQNTYEEVDILQLGGNYGWRCREGFHAYDMTGCPTTGFIDPVAEYDHSVGQSITGGYVYHGTQSTTMLGRYVFADYVSGRLWVLLPNASGGFTVTDLLSAGFNVSSFAQAVDGELYVVNYGGGLYHLVFQPGAGGGTIATSLAASGCVDASDPTQPASGLIPYDVNAAFWSDGAAKERWIALPNGQNMTVGVDGHWTPPNGSVLVKNFRLGTTLVETRLLMHHTDGSWAGYSYQWNDAQTDATLVSGGTTKTWGAQSWIYPSEAQCLQCHTAVAGRSLGLETQQFNRNFTYPQTGRTANEVATLNAINTLTPAIAADPSTLPALPDPAGSDTVASRARAYLHANCAQCHRTGGPTPVNLDFRYSTALSATNACNATPQAGDLGIGAAARIIAPGSAANSVLVARINRRGVNQMPPLASNQVDTAGVALLTQWINALATCN